MPQSRKPRAAAKTADDGPEPLVLTIAGEEFKFTTVAEVGDQKIQVPTLDWLEQLDFREQLEVRRIGRELSGNPQGEPPDFAPMDLVPALVTVVNQRNDPSFKLDDALALNWDAVQGRPPEAGTP